MPALALLTSDPANGATGVTTQQVITLTFNQDLRTSSVTSAVVQLFRDDADFPLPGGLAAAGDKITFIPDSSLHKDALYRIKIIGSDLGIGYALQASDGSFLATTVEITFRTGEPLYVPLDVVTERDDIEQIGPILQSDPLFATPTSVVVGALSFDDTVPSAYEKAGVDFTAVCLDFDRAIDASTVTTTTVKIEQFSVLGMDEVLASVPAGETEPKLAVQQGVDLVFPTGVLQVTDDVVKWTTTDPVLYNTEFQVTVTTGLQGTDGATLPAETTYLFTTDYVPLYTTPRVLRLELGPAIADLSDDTLCRLIHMCSLEAWDESGRTIPLTSPNIHVRKYVKCKVILKILAVLRSAHDLGAGEQKTLGDLTIRRAPTDPLLNMKYREAQECLKEIMIDPTPGRIAQVAVKGLDSGSERLDFRMRSWDHLLLSHVPGANTGHERAVKTWLSAPYALAGKHVHVTQSFFAISAGAAPHFGHHHHHH